MGLDVGHKRIGIALSDPLGVTTYGYEVLTRRGTAHDVAYIQKLCVAQDVTEIVVGQPLRTDGTAGPEVRFVEEFAHALRRSMPGIPLHFWDERFTTQQAERALAAQGMRSRKRRGIVDMAAAALILQSFMERRGRS